MNIYTKNYNILYNMIDCSNRISIVSILNILEDSAVNHSKKVGFGLEDFAKVNLTWVLLSWDIEIKRLPTQGETILVKTYPSNVDRFFVLRNFYVYDENDNEIISAKTNWILIDLIKRRPSKIPNDLIEKYKMETNKMVITKDIIPKDTVFNQNEEFVVRRADIDTNNHVNNSKYIEWMFELLPEEFYKKTLTRFIVEYKKETYYKEKIFTTISNAYENNSVFYHKVSSENQDLVLAKSFFQ